MSSFGGIMLGGAGESAHHLLPKIQGHEINVDVKMSLYLSSVIVE